MKALGQFIRDRRRELGLTQTQLGARIGYYQERISSLECGTYGIPSLHSMHELAAALEVPVGQLLAAAGSIALAEERSGEGVWYSRLQQLPQSQMHLRSEYETMCRRLLETEELTNEMLRLRSELTQRRDALRALTASCAQVVR
jgi:transcriptional regulator with XRE-family HTH domain